MKFPGHFCEKVIRLRSKEFSGRNDLKKLRKPFNPWPLSCTENMSISKNGVFIIWCSQKLKQWLPGWIGSVEIIFPLLSKSTAS